MRHPVQCVPGLRGKVYKIREGDDCAPAARPPRFVSLPESATPSFPEARGL